MITDHFARCSFLKWVWKVKFGKIFSTAGLRNPNARIIQTFYRKLTAILRYREARMSTVLLQSWWRRVATGAKYAKESQAVVVVQKYWRKDMMFFRHQVNRRAATIVQSWYRGVYRRRYGNHNMHVFAFASDKSGRKIKAATLVREIRPTHVHESELKHNFMCEALDETGNWRNGVIVGIVDADGGEYKEAEKTAPRTFGL